MITSYVFFSTLIEVIMLAAAVLLFLRLRRLRKQYDELLRQKEVVFAFVHDVGEVFADAGGADMDLPEVASPRAGGAPRGAEPTTGDPGRSLSLLRNVAMDVTAELGRSRMTVSELLSLTPGSVVELDKTAGSPVDLLVNGTLIARGEVVVIDEEFGIRISEIVDRTEEI